jgi:hypothetical protein
MEVGFCLDKGTEPTFADPRAFETNVEIKNILEFIIDLFNC